MPHYPKKVHRETRLTPPTVLSLTAYPDTLDAIRNKIACHGHFGGGCDSVGEILPERHVTRWVGIVRSPLSLHCALLSHRRVIGHAEVNACSDDLE